MPHLNNLLSLHSHMFFNLETLQILSFRFLWRLQYIGIPETSLVAQTVKRLPTVRETWVRSLGQEDPLEKEMATHSSTLAWKIPWTEEQ